MIDSLIHADNIGIAIMELLQRLVIVLIALTVHEVAHGWAANKLGDDTAAKFGRLSLNPLKHLNPWGFVSMLLFGFGWANPVPIRVGNFKHPRRGMAISALAGPMSNLLLALVGIALFELLAFLGMEGILPISEGFSLNLYAVAIGFLRMFITMNISLTVFNFLPVPPLDGSRVLYAFLPDKLYFGVMKYEQTISIVLIALLFIGLLDAPLIMAVNGIYRGLSWLIPII